MTEVNYRGLNIPFTHLGNLTSDCLFGPNEQVIFDFYEVNAGRYKRALDIGANIGVHSILMARQGWVVQAFEPDPVYFEMLKANALAHDVEVHAMCAAMSDYNGVAEFVRVLDNPTGSHLTGCKDSYGPRERFSVPTQKFYLWLNWADFAKIDCEGHEAVLIKAIDPSAWQTKDAILEVGSAANAEAIYYRLIDKVPMWAQKIGWGQVRVLSDMPTHHVDGSLFIGKEPPFK